MNPRKIPPTGELRRSQILTTFGPGSMVDLPKHSVLIGGLEYWKGDLDRIHEERLEDFLKEKLKISELKLFAPPVDPADDTSPRSGIASFLFPTWFLGQVEEKWRAPDGREYRTRPLVKWDQLTRGGYLNRERKVKPVVPVRFVQACVRGHISDIDWHAFVRSDHAADRSGELWLDEGGAGNDFAEIYVRDVSRGDQRRPLSQAAILTAPVLGNCQGHQPWLGPRVRERCGEMNRLLTRAASNTYFSQTVRVISIPDADEAVKAAVDRVYEDFLQFCESEADIKRERRKDKVASALEGLSDGAAWAEVARRLAGTRPVRKGIRDAEIETLLRSGASLGEDRPDGDFFARTHPLGGLPFGVKGKLDRVVLVHRLREVTAQIGFTRIDPVIAGVEDELDIGVRNAPLSRELTWLPAGENRGEGVFLSFSPASIADWLEDASVRARGEQLEAGFQVWKERKQIEVDWPGLPYIMLHSLGHLLITAVSLDCGYSASAIRERIYSGESGYGILLYTGAPGSEGTLGGLVDIGKNIKRHLTHALELGRLCSNDPVCAQHEAEDRHEERFLHGAACHGCLLIAETCCERRNELLDRALVVPTVSIPGAAYFKGVG